MYDFETRAVHVGQNAANEKHKHVPSIVYNGSEPHSKSIIIVCIASLEYGKYGLCYPSGLTAVTSISKILKEGDHVVLFDSVYHGTRTYLSVLEKPGKVEITFVDLRDSRVLKNHLKENTKMVWIETPSNPTMKIVDISAVADIITEKKDTFLVVDNTFMTPYFQNPLLLGADIVMHSLTKYMNGHSDCLMGAVAMKSEALYLKLKETRDAIGTVPSPMECFLVNRGLKTLPLRMKRHMQNAFAIAQYLEQHPKVEKVFYPGLKSHPQHELAKKQCKGFNGMVSFCIKGELAEAKTFVSNLQVFTLAGSLGSLENLIEIPSFMTASHLTKEKREEIGIPEKIIRMSIGIETAKDLIADVEQALERI